MRFLLLFVACLVVLAVLAHLVGSARFAARAQALSDMLGSGPATRAASPPPAMRRFAERNGAGQNGPARAVRLTQDAALQRAPGLPFDPAPATQTFGLGAPGFVWFAETPGVLVPKARVIDAYVGGEGRLSVRLFGSIPVADAEGTEIDRAEAMRYLAELPWIPDAILGNPEIVWTERDDGWIEASLPLDPRPAAVRFRLVAGDIVEMRADDRPAEQDADGTCALRDWRAVFGNYAEIGGRRIPTEGEVGYIREGTYAPYFRSTVTSYQILR
ncbi:MAG: hypothetical protein QNJ13_07320 [Paracoccaceae bacterium]|nr:hypothetical protein [Paracoccaceae bacterium]